MQLIDLIEYIYIRLYQNKSTIYKVNARLLEFLKFLSIFLYLFDSYINFLRLRKLLHIYAYVLVLSPTIYYISSKKKKKKNEWRTVTAILTRLEFYLKFTDSYFTENIYLQSHSYFTPSLDPCIILGLSINLSFAT